MIVSWMLHVVAISALLTVAAVAAERVLRLWGTQARAVWAVAMAASLALPLTSLAQAAGFIPSFGSAAPIPQLRAAPIAILLPRVEVGSPLSRLDIAMALAWLVASVGLTTRFVLAARSLARRRAAWRTTTVDGHRLLLSRDAGPAVIGFREPTVVIPEWVLGLEASLRALVLRHEREHLERGDPRLLLGAVAIATVAPWNPLLWFQLYRLRSAMELDCDVRVLRAHPDARRYGSLLLAVAQRADRGELLAAALTESNSLLARRIAAMRRPLASHRGTKTVLLAASAVLAAMVACEMQSPSEPTIRPMVTGKPSPVIMPADAAYFEFQVEQPVTPATGTATPRYPELLRKAGIQGEVLAQFVVGPDGLADVGSFKVLKSSHKLLTEAVRNALPEMRFNPALVGGKAVHQLVQEPFTFSMTK